MGQHLDVDVEVAGDLMAIISQVKTVAKITHRSREPAEHFQITFHGIADAGVRDIDRHLTSVQ